MQIYYGITNNKKDITQQCIDTCCNGVIFIPAEEINRCQLYGDPVYGHVKSIFLVFSENEQYEVNANCEVQIDLNNKTINQIDIVNIVKNKHEQIKLKYNDWNDELTMQKMVIRHIKSNFKVLQVVENCNISLMIASCYQMGLPLLWN